MNKNYTERIRKILGNREKLLKKIPENSGEYFEEALSNCENIVGTLSVPVGVAGPLKIKGFTEELVVPFATTEGCLVASINRGMKAIYLSGGAEIALEKVGITRAPVFEIESAVQAKKVIKWLEKNLEKLKAKTKETSKFLGLLKVSTKQFEKYLFIKFYFDAKDAMGMNMATIATDYLIRELITPETGIKCIALSGNLCVDKKAAIENLENGRGFMVKAEVNLSRSVLEKVLKTNAHDLEKVYQAKIVTGSMLAGSLGSNAHFANIIAAIYLATGQDIAHVVEGSLGDTYLELAENGDVVFGVLLPCVVCGVVGGGTHLPKQKEALKLLGVLADPENPGLANEKFAKIIAASVLAGELSLLAAIASEDLAKAHGALRKKKS